MSAIHRLARCIDSVRQKTRFEPQVALVLGSGLNGFADMVEPEITIDYSDIVGFPVSTAPGHVGRFIFGRLGGVRLVVMQGRVHYYEGYPMEDVVLPARLMAALGAKVLFLTNAAGGINQAFKAGDLMLIEDHISCFVPSPLIGPNEEELGVRFPDMSAVYDVGLRQIIETVAKQQGLALQKGIYCQTSGPQFETPAEVRMLRGLGADAVGMSTACEAIAAKHLGLRVCGVSCISNLAAGMQATQSGDDVNETASGVAPVFRALVGGAIQAMAKEL